MKRSHINIPVFIPHLGCPNMCVFCNQRAISGVCSFIPETAHETIETALSTVDPAHTDAEIAFFGGSFTGIDRELMQNLLDLAEEYVQRGQVSGIRMSTRPDYIDEEIIGILSRYTVSAVELGIQSFSESVLQACRRGHTPGQTEQAIHLLTGAGFSVVGQMMIGLPGSTEQDEVFCAEKIVSLGAEAARIYPTLVFRDTELAEQTAAGTYHPLTVDEAVQRSASVLDVFIRAKVPCLRIGLCESENLHTEQMVAGPNHPSLGELVYGELYGRKIEEEIQRLLKNGQEVRGKILRIAVCPGEISKAAGQKGRNKKHLLEKYGIKTIKFLENPRLTRYNIVLSFI